MTALTTLLRSCGVSYRQFDHWCTKGYIPGLHEDEIHPGYGTARPLTDRQARHLLVMSHLVRAGFRPDAATSVAAQIISGGTPRFGPYAIVPAHRIEEPA